MFTLWRSEAMACCRSKLSSLALAALASAERFPCSSTQDLVARLVEDLHVAVEVAQDLEELVSS